MRVGLGTRSTRSSRRWRPPPLLAQIAPSRGDVIADVGCGSSLPTAGVNNADQILRCISADLGTQAVLNWKVAFSNATDTGTVPGGAYGSSGCSAPDLRRASRLSPPPLPGIPMTWASVIAKWQNVIDGRSAGQPEIESLSWC
jgi:hypothetical protein